MPPLEDKIEFPLTVSLLYAKEPYELVASKCTRDIVQYQSPLYK